MTSLTTEQILERAEYGINLALPQEINEFLPEGADVSEYSLAERTVAIETRTCSANHIHRTIDLRSIFKRNVETPADIASVETVLAQFKEKLEELSAVTPEGATSEGEREVKGGFGPVPGTDDVHNTLRVEDIYNTAETIQEEPTDIRSILAAIFGGGASGVQIIDMGELNLDDLDLEEENDNLPTPTRKLGGYDA